MKKLIKIMKETPNKNFTMMWSAVSICLICFAAGLNAMPYAKTLITIAAIAFSAGWVMPLQTYHIQPWPLIGVLGAVAGIWLPILYPIGILLFFIAVFLQKEEIKE